MKDNLAVQGQFDSYCHNSAIALIFLGIIHIFLPLLDRYWGILLVAVGLFSFFVRKKSTLLISGVVLILAGVFNGLALFLGYVEPSNIRWAIFGVIQVFLGASEFVKYFKLRKIKIYSNTNKIIEISGYIALFIIFILYIYMSWFYVSEYTLIKDENGRQFEIPASECIEPYFENFDRCCILHENYSWLCDDEGQDYGAKLDLALLGEPTTNQMIYNEQLGMSFQAPENYYLIKDTKEGGIPVPYLFVASLSNSTEDSIYITFFDSRSDNLTREEWNSLFEFLKEDSPDSEVNKTRSIRGHEILTIESIYRNEENNAVTYEKSVVFTEYNIRVRFEGIESGKDYVNEFDRLINNIRFDNKT